MIEVVCKGGCAEDGTIMVDHRDACARAAELRLQGLFNGAPLEDSCDAEVPPDLDDPVSFLRGRLSNAAARYRAEVARHTPQIMSVHHETQAKLDMQNKYTQYKDVFADLLRMVQAFEGLAKMVNDGDFDGALAVAEGVFPGETQADDTNVVSTVVPLLRHIVGEL